MAVRPRLSGASCKLKRFANSHARLGYCSPCWLRCSSDDALKSGTGRMANFRPSPENSREIPGEFGNMEVCGRWLSRNGRLQLTEVAESWSRKKSIEATVVWASVQDQKGHFNLLKLEEAIKEVYEDFKTLRSYKEERLAGEKLYLHSDRFRYYPDEHILRETLETLRIQRKELVLRRSQEVCSTRRPARYAQEVCFKDQEEDWGNQPKTIRANLDSRCVRLSPENRKKNRSLSERKERVTSLFCLCGKKKEK
ncbi:uncharacterized protein LOC120298148 [Crotalus tigris]|uniref:uncharacterized protein LOC120298148 n=1 Tax=Crotalus tigris TaxID=88082 RepID=UPI00192F6483|nr:uncharacterized protein LOC120298148 [Crotalus tigris]